MAASTANAGEVIRNFADIEPINPGVARVKPDFETGEWRVDMTVNDVNFQLTSDGYTVHDQIKGSLTVKVGDKELATSPYVSMISASKMLEDGVTEEKLFFGFLPGGSIISQLDRKVKFHYRTGQVRLRKDEVEQALIKKFGKPLRIIVSTKKKSYLDLNKDGGNTVVEGVFCFEENGELMKDSKQCNSFLGPFNGYFFYYEANPAGEVVEFGVYYSSRFYFKSFMTAAEDKLRGLIQSDQIWEFRVPKIEP